MKRILTLLLAVALMTGVLAALPVSAEGEEPVTIVWYTPQFQPAYSQDSFDNVLAAVNDLLAGDGLKLDLRLLDSGEYAQKVQLMSASREESDLIWTGWMYTAQDAYKQGAILGLNEYMAEVPALSEEISIYTTGLYSGDELITIPCIQIMAEQHCWLFRKDLLDKYEVSVDEVKMPKDLTPIFEAILPNEPGIWGPTDPAANSSWVYDYEKGEYNIYPSVGGHFLIDPETMQVMTDEQAREFDIEYYSVIREWWESGYINPDLPTMTNFDDLWKSGMALCTFAMNKPGVETTAKLESGFDVVKVTWGLPIKMTGEATTISVASQSKHPAEALKLLEIVYTNPEVYNLLIFGLEGADYEYVDDNHIRSIEGGYSGTSWSMGNQFNALLLEGQDDDIWAQTIKMNEDALLSPLEGFTFVSDAVDAEYANLKAVNDRYKPILNHGMDDVEKTLDEWYAARKAAGYDVIAEELNRQLKEFAEK